MSDFVLQLSMYLCSKILVVSVLTENFKNHCYNRVPTVPYITIDSDILRVLNCKLFKHETRCIQNHTIFQITHGF